MNIVFSGIGWVVKLQGRRNNYSVSLVKELVLGNGLRKGMPLYYYLVTAGDRKAILLFLDGKGISSAAKIGLNTFLIK